MITAKELQSALNYCYGTEHWYRMMPFIGFKYTDGVKLLAEKAGAYWLVQDIASYIAEKKKLNEQAFLAITLKVKDSSADLIFDDGNDNVLYEKHYSFTDFPEGEWKLFFTDTVLMLPSEY